MNQVKDEILSLSEAAILLDVSQRTLIRLRDRGEISGFMIGNRWKFMRSEIKKYIRRQQEKDPTYLDRQIEATEKKAVKMREQTEYLLTTLGPAEKQAYIDGFFAWLAQSEWGQRIIDSLDSDEGQE
jgi:excisionase family DNA binding protein